MEQTYMESCDNDNTSRREVYQAPEIKDLGKFVSPTVTAGGSCACRCPCIQCGFTC